MKAEDYSWLAALRRAISRNRRDAHNRYLQLATVRSDGTPAVRTLVYRDLRDEAAELWMVTDRRSAKCDEIAARSAGEIAWYFSHTREQFRLGGSLYLSGADSEDQGTRQALWDKLSEKAREQFYWPEPGASLSTAGALPGIDSAATPPDSFLALGLSITRVDHLCLRGDPQTRWISERSDSGEWEQRPVNP